MSTDRTSKVQTARAEAEQNADPRVDLAVERTELAHERTQLAWVRTVFSLYTAGIALDKGLEILHKERILAGNNWVSTGHFSGILLAILGTILSGLMTVIYFTECSGWQLSRGRLRRGFCRPAGFPRSPPYWA